MGEPLFHVLGLPVTAYAAGMALSALAGVLYLRHRFGRLGLGAERAEALALLALPLCLLLARAAYVLIRLNYYLERGGGAALRLWEGGYAAAGAAAGFLLAVWLAGRRFRVRPGRLADAAAPAGLLFLALARFCEGLAGQGFGQEVPPGFAFFPLAVGNEYGEWRWAVFLLEGAAALLFLALARRREGTLREGGLARYALLLVLSFQILFESLREDEVLSWGFVRVHQLLSAAGLFALMAEGLFRRAPGAWRAPRHLAVAAFFLLLLLVVALEFALDKTTLDTRLIYALMLLACLGLSRTVAIAAGLGKRCET